MSASEDTRLDRGDQLHAPGDLPGRYTSFVARDESPSLFVIYDKAGSDAAWMHVDQPDAIDLEGWR